MNIVKMLFGSHLYGTSTENSDKDYKGIFIPSKQDCYLGNIPKSYSNSSGNDSSKNTKDDIDEEIYSLQYFIKLACEGQTVAIDMLHCNDECLIETSDIWKELVVNRKKFYTKNLDAFIGYARKQASKYGIKGSRLNTVEEVLNFLKNRNEDKISDVWDKLPQVEHIHILDDPKNKDIKFYQVCGKKFQSTAKIDYVIPILEKFLYEYGHRAQLAKENKGIDWKACSHALRAAYQVKSILLYNDLTFPLKESNIILDVKNGNVDYINEFSPLLETLMNEVEELTKISKLPEKVDKKFWNKFIIDVYNSLK